jgi:hypothetical protein
VPHPCPLDPGCGFFLSAGGIPLCGDAKDVRFQPHERVWLRVWMCVWLRVWLMAAVNRRWNAISYAAGTGCRNRVLARCQQSMGWGRPPHTEAGFRVRPVHGGCAEFGKPGTKPWGSGCSSSLRCRRLPGFGKRVPVLRVVFMRFGAPYPLFHAQRCTTTFYLFSFTVFLRSILTEAENVHRGG